MVLILLHRLLRRKENNLTASGVTIARKLSRDHHLDRFQKRCSEEVDGVNILKHRHGKDKFFVLKVFLDNF